MAVDPTAIVDQQLARCTVRIHVDGPPNGTGFFVAPHLIVTCAHVVYPDGTDASTPPKLTVFDPDGDEHDVLSFRALSPRNADDLALIQLKRPCNRPCVLLSREFRSVDPLHGFGYAENYPQGMPISLEGEGWLGTDERWLKLKGSQVRRGMSGSPLFNARTGAVSAVLKRSAGVGHALGGFAVSTKVLLDLEPTLSEENMRFHQTHREWIDQLTTEQKRAFRQYDPRSTARRTGTRFVISVGPTRDGGEAGGEAEPSAGWWVTAHVHPANGGPGKVEKLGSIQVDLNSVQREAARLFRDWASQGRVDARDQVKLLGQILSSAILPDGIGERLDELLADVEEERILLALHFGADADPTLEELPWEHLYIPKREEAGEVFVASDPKLAFVRAKRAEPASHDPIAGALSVLVVPVAPRTHEESSPKEIARAGLVRAIANDLGALKEELPGVDVTVMEEPRDAMRLREELEANDYKVVHYVGFGQYRQRELLALHGNTESGIEYVGVEELSACFEPARRPLLVFQLCEGPSVPHADFAVMASALVSEEIPAAIGYQYPVPSSTVASLFNRKLYVGLANGGSVEAVVQAARAALRPVPREGRAFIAPAVFLHQPGEVRIVGEARERVPMVRRPVTTHV